VSDASGSGNAAFTVGLVSPPDLDPARLPPIIDAVRGFLAEIKRLLPDTRLGLLFEAANGCGGVIARECSGPDVSLDALPAEPGGEARADAPAPADVLLRRSSLLLAVWDGAPSSAPDDAPDLVFRFLGVPGEQAAAGNRVEVSAAAAELDLTARLVYWVPAPRAVEPGLAGQRPCYVLAAGDDVLDVQHAMPSTLRGALVDLNDYNAEFRRFEAGGAPAHSASLLAAEPALAALSDAPALRLIDTQFVRADTLAGDMQRRSDRLFNVFGITALTMGVAYLVYDKITESKVLLMLYALVLFLSLLTYYFFHAKRWFGKYLSYRALAETLRVRFYLAVAGIDRVRARDLIGLTGISRFPGFGWIGFVLDSIEPAQSAAADPGATRALRDAVVERAWIEDQYRYFARKVASMEKHRFWIGRLKRSVFVVVLLVLSVMFTFGGALHNVDARTGLPFKNVLTFCSGTLAVVLGVWELRQNKMAVQELLWQYRNQLSQFQRARRQLHRTANPGRRQAVLEQLGANSLMEIYLWAIHRYHREHAPPAAP